MSDEIDQLLAVCGSAECLADILENLEQQIWYPADKVDALKLLAAGQYKPAFPEAEKLALDGDEESEVKRAALSLMRATSDSSTDGRLQKTIKILELDLDFMKAYGDDIRSNK